MKADDDGLRYSTSVHQSGGPVPDSYWEVYRDLATFTVREVARPAVRRGPILVGTCTAGAPGLTVGVRLRLRFGPWPALTVLAVEAAPSAATGPLDEPRRLPPEADAAEVALLVHVDGPTHWLRPGLELDVLPSDDDEGLATNPRV